MGFFIIIGIFGVSVLIMVIAVPVLMGLAAQVVADLASGTSSEPRPGGFEVKPKAGGVPVNEKEKNNG